MECTYCKEEIQEGAVHCEHCNSELRPDGAQPEALSAFGYFVHAFKEYATFSGRARRKEFWFFMLFYMIFMFVATILDSLLGLFSDELGMGLFGAIFAIGALLPNLAVTIRRLHDINRSAWWILISFIPLIGAIILLIFLCSDSEADNQYGKSPKGNFF